MKYRLAEMLGAAYKKNEIRFSIASDKPLSRDLVCSNETCECRLSNFLWISHRKKIIYIEVPKSACSSIKNAFDMRFTDDIRIEGFLRRRVSGDQSLRFEPCGFGNSVSTKKLQKCINHTMRKIDDGKMESVPRGKFEFSHSFDSPSSLLNRFPFYDVFLVMRDPVQRFFSALNMFYDPLNKGRRIQRLSHANLIQQQITDVNDAIDEVFSYPNHHFDPTARFLNGIDTSFIKILPISEVSKFIKDYGGKGKKLNASKRRFFDSSSASTQNMLRIKNFYYEDMRLINMSLNHFEKVF